MNRLRATLLAELAALRADQAQIHVWAQEDREMLAAELGRLRSELAAIEAKLADRDSQTG